VAGAAQLLRGSQSGRTTAHYRDPFAGFLLGRLGMNPSFVPGALHHAAFDQLDRDGRLIDGQHAGSLARRGTDAAGELREVVGRMQAPDGILPAAVVDEVVPIGDEVVHRATGVAEGHAAIHAAGALFALLLLGKRLVDLLPVAQPVFDLAAGGLLPLNLEKTSDLTHAAPAPKSP
jgi:hypothetical protein